MTTTTAPTPKPTACTNPTAARPRSPTTYSTPSSASSAGSRYLHPPRPTQHLDGISILPALKGQPLPADRPLFWHYPHYSNQGGPPGGALRLGNYKLIEHYEDGKLELYDLSTDLAEQHDLAPTRPDQATALHAQLHQWLKSVNAQMPTPNPDYNPTKPNQPARPAKPTPLED